MALLQKMHGLRSHSGQRKRANRLLRATGSFSSYLDRQPAAGVQRGWRFLPIAESVRLARGGGTAQSALRDLFCAGNGGDNATPGQVFHIVNPLLGVSDHGVVAL